MTPKDDHPSEPVAEAEPPARFFSRRVNLQSPSEALQPERPPPPPPPHRRRPTLSALSGFLSFMLLLSAAGLFGVIWGAHRVREPGPLAADKVLYIAPGTDFPDIVSTLGTEGVIDNELIFNLAVLAEGKRSKIKAGEYLFKQNASMRDVIDILVSGRQVLHSITIPEGLTSEQIVDRLRANTLLTGDILELPKEGSLLPETYKVPRGMARSEVIKRMEEAEKKLVAQIWANRDKTLILRSPYELVTLASIVEKETGKADERPRVAAVFLNRLHKHMRLQSDPTIVYGLVGGKGTLGRPIQRAEVEQPTPYNTYVIQGLPPGPITNPGRAALEAVANPSHTQDLYFVADGTGGHVFSQTLEQHNHNVQSWRRKEKEAKEKAGTEVDKFVPTPPARANSHGERSELDGTSVYGALPNSFGAASASVPSLGVAAAAAAIAKISPTLPSTLATASASAKAAPGDKHVAMASGISVGPGLEQLGISVRGVADPAAASAILDGPVDPGAAAPVAVPTPAAPTKPIPGAATVAQAQNQEKALAAALAAATGEAVPAANGAAKADAKPTHAVVVDASEGTPFDPLRDKTYDLNFPKTVPAAAAPPP